MSSSDLQVVFPAIVFVILIVFFSGFFIVNGTDFDLKDSNTIVSDDVPIYKNMVNQTNKTTEQMETEQNNQLVMQIIGGITAFFGGILIISGIGALPGLVLVAIGTGTMALNSPQALNVLKNIPVISQFIDGINYAATALASFWTILSWSPEVFGGFPVIGVLIMGPLAIFFFIFIIRFIRGQ